MGELLCLTPLPSLCGIELGDDIKNDCPDNAALLLGILVHLAEQLPRSVSENELARFKNKGIILLKQGG
ncbi:MAG: hypothetical protein LBH12_06435 [Dysgonamonadaceae bacterium]|nr:hypothetical protein [Dysgonamonadaceae bacterium]